MECLSKLDMETMLDGFQYITKCDLHTVVMWVEIGQIGIVRGVLEAKGYTNVQLMTWYKVGVNVVGPVFRLTPANEFCLIAYKGEINAASKQFNLSKDPLQRHNIIMGPPKRVLSKNAEGKEINMFEKPDYLASKILSMFAKSGQWVIVAGFGAGGDVRGAVNAGMNVVAIEADTQQYTATLANMRTFVPKDDLSMLVSTDLLSKAQKAEAQGMVVGLAGENPPCRVCGGAYVGKPSDCKSCGEMGCDKCFKGEPSFCKDCFTELEASAEAAARSGNGPALDAAAVGVTGDAATAGEGEWVKI